MSLGRDRALYLLPFDHRHSYVKNLFGITPLLSAPQIEQVAFNKRPTQTLRRFEAVTRIARRPREWVPIFERARAA